VTINNAADWKTGKICADLNKIKTDVYDILGYKCAQPVAEPESREYNACSFKLNTLCVIFRTGKITPTKIGQFVTVWKREGSGPTKPFDIHDNFDLFIISAKRDENFGMFIFPKPVLLKHHIISQNYIGGKRGFRLYPPWDVTINPQAKKTQQWQLEYFLEIPFDHSINITKVRQLLG